MLINVQEREEVMHQDMVQDLLYDAVIVGLGKSGFSCARFLVDLGQRIAVTDTRKAPPYLNRLRQHAPGVPVSLGAIDRELLLQTKQVIVSPGISSQDIKVDHALTETVSIAGDIEIFCRHAPQASIIAITGSNGKSTVTTLLSMMAKKAGLNIRVGGNLGTPALDLLAGERPDFYILELSSFQLDTTSSLNAHIAVVLNLCDDHLDRYVDFQAYVNSKDRIYDGDGIMVVNIDDARVKTMARRDRQTLLYSMTAKPGSDFYRASLNGEWWLYKRGEALIKQSNISITGEHNIANVLATIAIADAMGVPVAVMREVLSEFQGLPHRCQLVYRHNGVEWYNDSKATNVGACCAAIDGLGSGKNIVLIAGGDGKNMDFSPLAKAVQRHVCHVILLGRDAQLIAHTIGDRAAVTQVADLDCAVACAKKTAGTNHIVLFSPACSSLDMFKNYQERGERFINAVQRLYGCI